MAAGTNSIRSVGVSQDKSPSVTPPPRSISPVGNRTLQPKVTRAPRTPPKPKNTRDYGKTPAPTPGFMLPGFGPAQE